MTDLELYDNWTRSTRRFEPLNPDMVGLYSCGPTVYDYQHIGNLRTYIFVDGLKRTLRMNKFNVLHVMNITDVGHLTSDADDGEDKMEKGSRRTGKSASEIAQFYTDVFFEDLAKVNVIKPDVICKATDHIAEQIAFIADIEKNGFCYSTADGVYFDTSKLQDYGHLARLDKAGLDAGHRVVVGDKKQSTDFALWKFSKPDENRQMEWASPWGTGFPGWHIECSAMAQKYLGDYFDIHCGGEDHIPVHHTNEIAQTEARVGTRLANFWMHGYFLLQNDDKMAKSKGDFLRLQVVIDKGFDPAAYRFLCLTGHYRSQLNFTWDALESAQTALNRLRTQFYALVAPTDVQHSESAESSDRPDETFSERFLKELNSDLNFPRAIALVWEVLKSTLSPAVKRATLLEFDRGLGLDLANWRPKAEEAIPEQVTNLANARWQAKNDKNWSEADRLRAEVKSLGYEIEDQSSTFRIKKR